MSAGIFTGVICLGLGGILGLAGCWERREGDVAAEDAIEDGNDDVTEDVTEDVAVLVTEDGELGVRLLPGGVRLRENSGGDFGL